MTEVVAVPDTTVIPIREGLIDPSPYQPRLSFDAARLAELAESVARVGLQQYPVVRPKGGRYELVMGERRVRACRLAGFEEIPCAVRGYDDEQAAEAANVENLQRDDLNAAEEAQGFAALLALPSYAALGRRGGVEALARKLAKSPSYVWQRLKLLDLTDEARGELLAGAITAGHAILLARLAPEAQTALLTRMLWQYGYGRRSEMERTERRDGGCHYSVRELALQIASAGERMGDAPFDLGWVPPPKVGRGRCCVGCEARSTSDEDADASTIDVCRDPDCFKAKLAEHVRIRIAEFEAAMGRKPLLVSPRWTPETKGAIGTGKYDRVEEDAKGAEAGIQVDANGDGDRKNLGSVVWVRLKAESKPDPKAVEAEKKRKAELKAKVDAEMAYRKALLLAILSRVPAAPTHREMAIVAEALRTSDGHYQEGADVVAYVCGLRASPKRYDPLEVYRPLPLDGLTRYAVGVTCAYDFSVNEYNVGSTPKRLLALAAEYGVDPERVRNEAQGQATLAMPEAAAPSPTEAPAPPPAQPAKHAPQPTLDMPEDPGSLLRWAADEAMKADPGQPVVLDIDTFEDMYFDARTALPAKATELERMFDQGFFVLWGRRFESHPNGGGLAYPRPAVPA